MGERTTELDRLRILTEAVRGLREELVAYRWTIQRWLKRGSRAAIGIGLLVLLAMVAAGAAVRTAVHTEHIITELRRTETEHRVRNEMLHACLADLMLEIVQTDPDERSQLVNPCPEPLPPEELKEGADR